MAVTPYYKTGPPAYYSRFGKLDIFGQELCNLLVRASSTTVDMRASPTKIQARPITGTTDATIAAVVPTVDFATMLLLAVFTIKIVAAVCPIFSLLNLTVCHLV
jgi:hypothetical protein